MKKPFILICGLESDGYKMELNYSKIKYRPISKDDYQLINHKCWDDSKIENLFDIQNAIGIGGWLNGESVASLHFYDVSDSSANMNFPDYGINEPYHFPLGLPNQAYKDGIIKAKGKVLGLACYHVGLMNNTDDNNPMYYSKGIGTKLLKLAINWARENGYSMIIAHGCPQNLFDYCIGYGGLPWTRYIKFGFKSPFESTEDGIPNWFQGLSKGYMDRVKLILSLGGTNADIINSVMYYNL